MPLDLIIELIGAIVVLIGLLITIRLKPKPPRPDLIFDEDNLLDLDDRYLSPHAVIETLEDRVKKLETQFDQLFAVMRPGK